MQLPAAGVKHTLFCEKERIKDSAPCLSENLKNIPLIMHCKCVINKGNTRREHIKYDL
ncbi:hypothetical protein HMPREF3293_01105 [Christensenella minuta]|uniref:Uncharacterized protein n=1 Tax=Christensenella minuta TaxID=626937 RepID=A0A136Q5T0_9FIRM|nr:hypothetical protein HMPREF3293_01105 [Christensenella minuta]